MYQGFRLKLNERSQMIIFRSLSTTFKVSNILNVRWGISKNYCKPKIKPPKQVKLFQISDTDGIHVANAKKNSKYLMLQTSKSLDTISGGNCNSSSGNLDVNKGYN